MRRSSVSRPVLRYHGGKWRLAPWIVGQFPFHRIYVEPFCGAASVLMRKPRSHAEVINDLEGDVVNLFCILRDREKAVELERLLRLTPFARKEFETAYEDTGDPVERARRTVVRAFLGFGTSASRRTGFRAKSYKQHLPGAAGWAAYPGEIKAFVERL
jgi:DNA adenine methylase